MTTNLKFKSVQDLEERSSPLSAPTLLVHLEPWHRAFLHNLRHSLWPKREEPLLLSSQPAAYWPDVFVVSHLPWGRFTESAVFHVAVIAVLWSTAQWWPRGPQLTATSAFHHSDVVYYEPSDYPLPPLNTGGAKPKAQAKGNPAYAQQPIISVPPEPDNLRQTIVTPPQLKLNRDVPLPNVVAWGHPATAIAPTALVSQVTNSKLPELPVSVVAPAPEVNQTALNRTPNLTQSAVAPAPELNAVSRRSAQLSQPAIIEPPPSIQTASTRTLSDINIGPSAAVAPAPQLPMSAQHARQGLAQAGLQDSGAVAPPPPRVQGGGGTSRDGRLIALNLQAVAPNGPVEVPNGNRRGTFAATPEGKPGAAGTPDASGGNSPGSAGRPANGAGRGAGSATNPFALPSGLYVGATAKPANSSVSSGQGEADPPLMASATPPRTTSVPRRRAAEMPPDLKTEDEKSVFGPRRFYAMTLNVPNLNSSGGSWVMHFAELKDAEKQGDLLAPVATRAVDPGYPLELMRQNVKGTVTLSAVIQSDGSVGEVKVLNGIDDRLDQYARNALSQWRFLPALRAGNPVALQAVVMIPFRPTPRKTGF